MKTVFVVLHCYQDFDNNYSDVVGVWQNQIKAKEFCEEMHLLQSLCKKFMDSVDQMKFDIPKFSKTEPVRDDSLRDKMKSLETNDPNSKETKTARKEWMKYIDPFTRNYNIWKTEKFEFDKIRNEKIKIAKRNSFIETMMVDKMIDPDRSIKILKMYDRIKQEGWYEVSCDSSIYEVKETTYNV